MQNNHRIVKRPAHAIESVENALRILLLLQDRDSLRIVDVAQELSVAPSTAHRFLTTLVYRGFAVQDEQRHYSAGPNLRLNAVRSPLRKLVATARPFLETLAAGSGETVNLVERVGTSAKFLYSVEGPQLLRIGDRAGSMLPASISAGGLAALSILPDADVAQLYRRRSTQPTGNGLESTELRQLLGELAQVRSRGYSLNIGRTEHELAAVGSPIGLPQQQGALAVSLSAPLSRAEELQNSRVISLLHSTCAQIREKLDRTPTQPTP